MKHAAYCGTRGIYKEMELCAKSLVANSDVERVWFIIEDDEFPSELPSIVQCVNMSDQRFFKADSPNMNSQFTYMAMMRAALCHVLPDVDKVLALDCDTVCLGDVSDVWGIDIADCYFAATPEWTRTENGFVYCNIGVTLYNLDKMRDGKADEIIEVLNRHYYRWVEQDVCNYLCQGRIEEMPFRYNSNYWTNKHNDSDVAIQHYAGIPREQWTNSDVSKRYMAMTWGEVMRLHNG